MNRPATGVFITVVLAGVPMFAAAVWRARAGRIDDTRRQWLQRWLTLGVWVLAVIVVPIFATTTEQPKLSLFVTLAIALIINQVRHDVRSR